MPHGLVTVLINFSGQITTIITLTVNSMMFSRCRDTNDQIREENLHHRDGMLFHGFYVRVPPILNP